MSGRRIDIGVGRGPGLSVVGAKASATRTIAEFVVPAAEFTSERGLSLAVHELEENRHGRFGLPDAQDETLVAALEVGYDGIPRGMDTDELSNGLEISHQTLSEGLRRAHRALVEEVIGIGESDESER